MIKDSCSLIKKIKKGIALFITIIFISTAFPINYKIDTAIGQEKYPIFSETGYLVTSSKSAILIDADSGRVLWEKNPHKNQSPASITKIMTAIIAIENGDLKDKVVVSEEATLVGESEVWLEEGEIITFENLIYSALLFSANDACHAIAEHISGSVEEFMDIINKKAKEIGAINTYFVNPHGLDDEENGDGNISTAYDIAQIARYCMKNPKFAQIVNTRMKVMPGPPSSDEKRYVTNRNKFLNKYQYANGIKTGYTIKAGLCLAASAKKEDINLIGVVLDSEPGYRDQDMINIFEYGFSKYKKIDTKVTDPFPNLIIENEGIYKEIEVNPIEKTAVLLSSEEEVKLQTKIEIDDTFNLPVKGGEKVGHLNILLGNDELLKLDISSKDDVDIKSNEVNLSEITSSLWKYYIRILIIIFIFVLVFLSFKKVIKLKKVHRR